MSESQHPTWECTGCGEIRQKSGAFDHFQLKGSCSGRWVEIEKVSPSFVSVERDLETLLLDVESRWAEKYPDLETKYSTPRKVGSKGFPSEPSYAEVRISARWSDRTLYYLHAVEGLTAQGEVEELEIHDLSPTQLAALAVNVPHIDAHLERTFDERRRDCARGLRVLQRFLEEQDARAKETEGGNGE